MIHTAQRFFGLTADVPEVHRRNFIHLYLDIAFWGLFNGSILVFLGVYLSRLGASPIQVGLLTSIPAFANVVFTFPASAFARGRSISRIVPRAALVTRLLYGLLIPLPILLKEQTQTQVWVILLLIMLVNIPGTLAVVLGNAFFAEAVPDRYRGHVVGMRNALLAAASMLASFSAGLILKFTPFHWGYMVVFAIGVLGLLLSAVQLFLVKPVQEQISLPLSQGAGITALFKDTFRFDILRSPFASMLVVMFFFHLAVFLPGPMFPLYQVHQLKISDQTISLGTSLFWVVHFITSTQSGRLGARFGFKRLLGIGTLIFSAATILFTYGYQTWIYLAHSVLSGIGWALVGGSQLNYLLEKIPPGDRPAYLAWFNMIVNVAVLICGLIAAPITGWMGLVAAMLFAIFLRFLAGAAILRWG
jgi:MFS family permease